MPACPPLTHGVKRDEPPRASSAVARRTLAACHGWSETDTATIGARVPRRPVAEAELRAGLPFLEIALVRRRRFDLLVRFFATDRSGSPKGMVEVMR